VTKLNAWWDKHHNLGGTVWSVDADWDIVDSPEHWIDDIYSKYSKLSFEQVLSFSEAEVTDNSMPDREILEEGSKIYYLTNEMKNKKIKHVTQLLHEPWHDRYRVHPGSGRTSALWLNNFKTFPCIYIHFNEGEFCIPKNSTQLKTKSEFIDATVFQEYTEPQFETYPATISYKTKMLDSEWTYVSQAPWEFIRWSEGKKFLNYKKAWRETSIDCWLSSTEG
jgi:hypothetical protein